MILAPLVVSATWPCPLAHALTHPCILPHPFPYRAQVECPGEYGSLEEYFRHYRNPQLAPLSIGQVDSAPHIPATLSAESAHPPGTQVGLSFISPDVCPDHVRPEHMCPDHVCPDHVIQIIQHPVGCFSQFLCYFGPHVFTLWRLALLKKRVLMFSQPPIGEVCHRGESPPSPPPHCILYLPHPLSPLPSYTHTHSLLHLSALLPLPPY